MSKIEKGDRLRIVRLMDDPAPLPLGTEGTVDGVTDFGQWQQLQVRWDNGRSLMLVLPEDELTFEVVS